MPKPPSSDDAGVYPVSMAKDFFPPNNVSLPDQRTRGTDADDLLDATGNLSHGGRAYRRELVARITAEWARKSGGFTRGDAKAAVLSANRLIEALVADDTKLA